MPTTPDNPSKTRRLQVRLPRRPTSNMLDIPGEPGLPLIGQTFEFLHNPLAYKRRMRARYGDVFYGRLFFKYGVVFVGPESAREILQDKQKNFSSRFGWDGAFAGLLDGGLFLRDFDEHLAHRRIMNVAFQRNPMRGYMDVLNRHIEAGIANWHRDPNLRMFPAIKQLTLNAAARVFVGLEIGRESATVNQAFIDVIDGTVAVLPFAVPGMKLWAGLRGRQYLETFVGQLVRERRRRPVEGQDMLSVLCRAVDEDGERFSDEEVIAHMIAILAAAHDTTTGALVNMVFELARRPAWQDRLRAQIRAVGTLDLDYDDVGQLGDLDLVFREILRLYPPISAIPRRTIEPCTVQGTRLAANTIVFVNTDINHRLPEWWTRPDDFDPERFGPERAEHRRHSYLWLPFGGGAHRCIGARFAELNARTFIYHLLSRYRLRVPPGYEPELQYMPTTRPKRGLPMILERID